MINVHMAEAQRGFAILQDVDFETFNRFIQWAYIGYYSAANFDLDNDEVPAQEISRIEGYMDQPVDASDEDVLPPEEVEGIVQVIREDDYNNTGWGGFSSSSGKGKKHKKKTHVFDNMPAPPLSPPPSKDSLKTLFINRQPKVREESIAIPPLRANQDPREDYTEVFLSHARLHVFAEMYDIQALKTLAIENLHGTLAIFTFHKARTGDIVELLRYVYNSTRSGPGAEDLRTLMVDYLAYEMDVLNSDKRFKELMIEDGKAINGGGLLDDYMKMVAKRIRDGD